ncbi:EamA family transporter [Fusibacter paucivorans]|uniref:EamA family transporter n=1 Tax=Fusibacter paucivorans TaxID=76009 RepID=A0ABS5PK46_9FIRM|nr:DMT family transporter [Fusibacter paucivorans]MBS7525534.1 EamA family transporter [Fusibacter paucivorans]
MNAFSLGLVVFSTFCHAYWNFALKRSNGGIRFMWLFTTITVALYLPYMMTMDWTFPTMKTSLMCAGSFGFHFLYFLALDKAYQFGDLSIIYPVARGLAPAVTVLIAIVLLHEQLTALQFAGVAIIVAGTFALSGLSFRGGDKMAASVCYAIVCGLMVSSYTLIDKIAIANAGVSPFVLDFVNNLGRSLLLMPVAFKDIAKLKETAKANWRDALIVAVLSPFSYLLILFAMRYAPVSLIAPIRQLSIVISGVIGIRFLQENKTKMKLIGIGATFCGVVLLSV